MSVVFEDMIDGRPLPTSEEDRKKIEALNEAFKRSQVEKLQASKKENN